jgi:hypothetical protein
MSLFLLLAIVNSNESFRSSGHTHRAHGHSVNGLEEGGGMATDETSDEGRVEPICRTPGNSGCSRFSLPEGK